MSKGWKINLLLLLIFLSAVGGLWWLDHKETKTEIAEKKERLVSKLDVDSVVSMQWSKKGEKTVSLEKKDKKWRIISPVSQRTDSTMVVRMVTISSKTFDQKVSDTPTSLASFGLEEPLAMLTLNTGSGLSEIIKVGSTSPASKKRYLQLGEKGPVVLIADHEVSMLLKDPNDLRDKKLFSAVDTNALKRIELKQGEKSVLLEKNSENSWNMVKPFQDVADQNRVLAWSRSFVSTTGTGFESVDGEEFEWILELEDTNGVKETVYIGKKAGGQADLLAQRQGESDRLLLSRYLLSDLKKTAFELVSLHPLGASQSIEKLTVQHQGKTLTVEKKEGKWPQPVWDGVEEGLNRESKTAFTKPVFESVRGEPWITVTAFQGDKKWDFPLWVETENVIISPPNRPVELGLSALQSKALIESVSVLFPDENPEEKSEEKSEVKSEEKPKEKSEGKPEEK